MQPSDDVQARAVEAAACDGLCLDSADVGVPGYGIAYPHPGCPLHGGGQRCACGNPDRCNSYTHDPTWAPTDTPTTDHTAEEATDA